MANIIGEPLRSYVIGQINARQKLHGSGAGQDPFNPRNDFQINLLNSNTSWIKLASGISVSEERLAEIGLGGKSFSNMGLAKNYILYAGISKLGTSSEGYIQTQQREGFNPQQPDSSYTYGDYGYSPMPGITSADIKALNRGSLKKANVKLTVNNKQQFDIIDLLYLRLGYTVLLEWGNSIYTPDGVTRKTVRNTLTETLFFEKGGKGSYLDMLKPIEQTRAKYQGNYDALLGKVSNFSWAFKEDGSYEIELTIISLGDVVESLKSNISIDKATNDFINNTKGTLTTTEEESAEPDPIEENKDANAITAMLYLWKFLNPTITSNEINIKAGDGEVYSVGGFLNSTQGSDSSTITSKKVTVEYVVIYKKDFYIESQQETGGFGEYNGPNY
jgi:hypothetical protein